MTNAEKSKTLSFKEAPNELKALLRNFVRTCFFRTVQIENWDDLPIDLKRQANGWSFICRICPNMGCTGFVADKPTPKSSANKKSTKAES